jgi:mycofactocin precursor
MVKKDELRGEPLSPSLSNPATGPSRPKPERESDELLIIEDLLIEDVSIDGMCGVY